MDTEPAQEDFLADKEKARIAESIIRELAAIEDLDRFADYMKGQGWMSEAIEQLADLSEQARALIGEQK
jgi:hypothetical protein